MLRRAASLGVALLLQGMSLEVLAQTTELVPEPQFVFGEGNCPSAAEVTRETSRLTPQDKQGTYAENVRVTLQDLGGSYQLRILAPGLRVEKTYVDGSRDCSRRARFAAVLIVLTLMPPQVAEEPRPKDAVVTPTTSDDSQPSPLAKSPATLATPTPVQVENRSRDVPPKSKAERAAPWAYLTLGAALRWAPPVLQSPELLNPGGVLVLAIGPGKLRGFASVAYFATAEFTLRGIAARIRQLPIVAGCSFTHRLGALSLTGNVGVVAEMTRVQAAGLVASEPHSRLRWGTEVGTEVTLERVRLSPAWGLALELQPSPGEVSVAPIGRLGSLPALQLTTFLGGRIGF